MTHEIHINDENLILSMKFVYSEWQAVDEKKFDLKMRSSIKNLEYSQNMSNILTML